MKFAHSVLTLALLVPMLAAAQDKPAAPPPPAPTQAALHTYRLTFTLTETEAGKRVGVQHVSMTTSGGVMATARIGSRIPIATGNYSNVESKTVQTQMTYLDIGVNIQGKLRELGNSTQVTTKIEQSSMADTPPSTPADPIIRQALIENDALVTMGKPVMLGSLDIPGSTRHTDIELVVEKVQ